MIGHLLPSLTPAEEGRVLTTAMLPGSYHHQLPVIPNVGYGYGPCLMGVLDGGWASSSARAARWFALGKLGEIENRFDGLCDRFGVERTTRVIRNRILANQARRALAAVRETVSV